MSTPKTPSPPAGGKPPRVHHVHPTGVGGTPGGTTVEGGSMADTFNPEDYQNVAITDFLQGHLPVLIYLDGNQPRPALIKPPPQIDPAIPADQAARQVGDHVYAGLTTKTETFWDTVGEAARYGYLLDGFETRAVRISLPFNSTQICDGGLSVIKAIQSSSRAKCMEVDPMALGQDLALVLRVRRAKEVIGGILNILEANESVALGRVAETVAAGLRVGASIIATDGNLSHMLEAAMAIRGGPSAAALATKAANQRTEDAIQAAEQAKAKAQQAPTPAPTVLTVAVTPEGGSNKK